MLSIIAKGVVIGLSIAAPIGPIGLLCIRRSLIEGLPMGLATGLGATTADTGYGLIAGFGLTVLSSFFLGNKFWLAMIGGFFLCYLGVRSFVSKPVERRATLDRTGKSLVAAYLSTMLLALASPSTILLFVAIFSSLGLDGMPAYSAGVPLVVGVFIGSALWRLVLCGSVALFRSRVNDMWMQVVNRVSGAIMFGFGLLAILTAYKG